MAYIPELTQGYVNPRSPGSGVGNTGYKNVTGPPAQTNPTGPNSTTTPPGAPNTPADPYDTSNLPFQGVYAEAQGQANLAYQNAIANLQQQRSGYNLQYGFNDQGQEDPNNPLGLFEQQRNSEAQGLMQASQDSVDRGIGGIGLGAQEETALRHTQDAADNNLLGAYKGLLNQNDQDKLGAANTLQAALLQARRDQIQQAINAGYFTPQTADTSTSGDGSTTSSTSNGSTTSKPTKTTKPTTSFTSASPWTRTRISKALETAPKIKPATKPKGRVGAR